MGPLMYCCIGCIKTPGLSGGVTNTFQLRSTIYKTIHTNNGNGTAVLGSKWQNGLNLDASLFIKTLQQSNITGTAATWRWSFSIQPTCLAHGSGKSRRVFVTHFADQKKSDNKILHILKYSEQKIGCRHRQQLACSAEFGHKNIFTRYSYFGIKKHIPEIGVQ